MNYLPLFLLKSRAIRGAFCFVLIPHQLRLFFFRSLGADLQCPPRCFAPCKACWQASPRPAKPSFSSRKTKSLLNEPPRCSAFPGRSFTSAWIPAGFRSGRSERTEESAPPTLRRSSGSRTGAGLSRRPCRPTPKISKKTMRSPVKALLDANVLYSNHSRNLLRSRTIFCPTCSTPIRHWSRRQRGKPPRTSHEASLRGRIISRRWPAGTDFRSSWNGCAR